MRLSRPVLNKAGLVVMGENTELTESLIGKIQELGIDKVSVVGPAWKLPPQEEMRAALDRRFEKVEGEPHMSLLKRIIAEHIESLYEEHRPQDAQR